MRGDWEVSELRGNGPQRREASGLSFRPPERLGETFGKLGGPKSMSVPADRPKPEKGKTPDSTAAEKKPARDVEEDAVDEAGEESFPASDAPSWTGASAH